LGFQDIEMAVFDQIGCKSGAGRSATELSTDSTKTRSDKYNRVKAMLSHFFSERGRGRSVTIQVGLEKWWGASGFTPEIAVGAHFFRHQYSN
jgi:hypothetical protein